jgi:segregation and condensation protein A
MAADEYKVDLEVFEGPLDLLLYLIKRDEVDIYNIPIETITTQYMEYLNVMKMLDLNIAGEFLVMAATLMMIKSRMLLPVEERPELEEEEEDPRWDLVRQLVEYKQFKDAAGFLETSALYQENVFDAGPAAVEIVDDDPGVSLKDVSLFDLIAAFNDVLKKAPVETFGEIEGDRFTVADKIDSLLALTRKKGSVRFVDLLSGLGSRNEVICCFLALLELLKLQQISAKQEGQFGEIVIMNNENDSSQPYVEATEMDSESV